jgi:hypothetical protein
MKKTLTLTLVFLFAGASLFAQKPHHKKDGHKEIKKEYKHHHHHKNKTVVIQPTAPRPPTVTIKVPSPPKPPSVNIQLPSPPPPPRPPK